MTIEITLETFDLKEAFKRALAEVKSEHLQNAYWRKMTFEKVFLVWPDDPVTASSKSFFRFMFLVEPY